MVVFFFAQFFAFFISILVLTHWLNRLLLKGSWFDSQALPVFAWGWFVYFIIYRIGRWFVLPSESVRTLFTGMAFAVAIAGVIDWFIKHHTSFWKQRKQDLPFDSWTIIILVCFIVVMVYIGPYLEHPSDSVAYFARIQAWEKARWMNYSGIGLSTTFATFYEHWLLQSSGLSYGERLGLSCLSALTQGILLWELIRIARIVTGNIALSGLAGLMSLGYFGYTTISFYRYPVFSGPMLAYIVYLEALILIITLFWREQWRYLLLLPPLLWFCWNNHKQGTLLQLIAIIGIAITLILFRDRTLKPQFRNILRVAIAVGIFAAIAFLFHQHPLGVNLRESQNLHLFNIATIGGGQLYVMRYTPLSYILGIVGWFSILLSLFFLLFGQSSRKLDIMAGLTLFPLIVFWNPLGIEVLRRIMSAAVFHRLIYGCLYWMFPIFFLHYYSQKIEYYISKSIKKNINILEKMKPIVRYPLACLASLFLIFLSFFPDDPVFGKMIHTFLKVPKNLDGSDLKPAIDYVRENAQQDCIDPHPNETFYPIRRYILSDPYVNTYLHGTGYFYTTTMRWDISKNYESPPLGFTTKTATNLDYSQVINILKEKLVCYVIIYLPEKQNTSWLGRTSGHWYDTYAHTQRHYPEKFLQWVRESPQDFELVFEQDATQIFRVKNPNPSIQ